MDRLTRTLAGCGLALLASAGGCRTARDEVPPGRPYRSDGRQEAEVGFSTAPPQRPPGAFGAQVGGAPGNSGGGLSGQQPQGDYTGTIPGRGFGAPGTSGLTPPSNGGPLSGLGQAPPLGPSGAAPRNNPTYLNGIADQQPAGVMGSPGQPPSPN